LVESGDELEIRHASLPPSRWKVERVADDGGFWVARAEAPTAATASIEGAAVEGPLLATGLEVDVVVLEDPSEAETVDEPLQRRMLRERRSFRARVIDESGDRSAPRYRLEPAGDEPR